jgi:hypothetical protein
MVVSVKSNYEESDLSEIKALLHQYFDLVYESKNNNELKDLSSILDLTSIQNLEEIKKQELEIYINKSNGLYYDSYNYSLEFSEFSIDEEKQTASINVEERNEVIFNISILADKDNPVVSEMRVFHEFYFIKEDTGWKIETDFYHDELWENFKNSHLSFSEFISKIDENVSSQSFVETDPSKDETTVLSGLCPYLLEDSTSHEYNREGAAAYARYYAIDYNPNYFPFYADCTNFASQAIKHGGNSQMAYPDPINQGQPGSMGWYYTNSGDYARAWTWVDGLNDFVTLPEAMATYEDGPEGCIVGNESDLFLGDIIQFDESVTTDYWDHSVIITWIQYLGFGEKEYYISSHTEDRRDWPLSYVTSVYDDVRYIHIERIDGLIPTYISLVLNNYSSGYSASSGYQEIIPPLGLAYPAPGTNLLAPTETTRIGYP